MPPSPPTAPGEGRFTLLPTTRYVGWVAVATGGVLAALGPSLLWQALSGGAALAVLLATWAVGKRRPILIVDDAGYRVEVAGNERFRVLWSEVRRVLHDRSEAAVYVDCGDGRRNLLVPPAAGFAFTFSGRERLVQGILARLADKVEEVERLDKQSLPARSPSADKISAPTSEKPKS